MTVCRRLRRLSILGILRRLSKTNPAFYQIVEGQEELVRKIVYFRHTEELMEL